MPKPVKVLAVVCQMNRGGLESRLMDILRTLDYSRAQIDIFTYRLEKGVFDDEVTSLGGTLYYNPPLTAKNMFWYVGYFKRFLLQHPEYQIVHAHQDAWCSVFCKGAYLAGVPVRIAHSRTAIVSQSLTDVAKNLIKLPAKKYATHYFAVSKPAAYWLYGKSLVESGAAQVWPNAIDVAHYSYNPEIRQQVRNELHLTDEPVLLHVGNFTAPKNQLFLLKVFQSLVQSLPNAKLLFVGGGSHEKESSFVAEYGLTQQVFFLGVRDDVARLLQAADVFVFPSIFEGLPGAVVEAQAAGLPCILSDAITDEVCITPHAKQLSLGADISQWCGEISSALRLPRENTEKYLKAAGFDIYELTKNLTKFYTSYSEEQQHESL